MSKSKTVKESTKIILMVVIVFALLGGTYLFFANKSSTSLPNIVNQASTEKTLPVQAAGKATKADEQKSAATLEIKGAKYTHQIVAGENVYDFMAALRAEGKINFQDKTYAGMGKFVSEINGVAGNGTENWIYYVDGEKATIGVSNYKLHSGDVVSWKYEKSY